VVGTDGYSWSNRSTRLIGIAEAQLAYAVSVLRISRYSTPDDNVGRELGADRPKTGLSRDTILRQLNIEVGARS
jgi:hypothetical protein